MAHSHSDDHENGLIDGDSRQSGNDAAHSRAGDAGYYRRHAREYGAMAPGTVVLFAVGFVLGAVAIGSMGIAITPVDPPAVRPIELRSPDERDRVGDGDDRRRDRAEPRQGSARGERSRRRDRAAPVAPQARQQRPPAQAAPPAAAPRPRTPAPRPTPAPRSRPQPQPAPPPSPPPQPAPAPPQPPADDEEDPDDDAGNGDDDAGGADDSTMTDADR